MNVQIKSSNGIQSISMETRLLSERRIFVEGEIDSETACIFTKKVMFLNGESKQKPIDVLINTNGGEINAGLLMYDVIQESTAPIRMYCIGKAYSMGALLFASGNHGRYMLPHSELMLHEPLLGNRIAGNSTSIRQVSESLMETRNLMNQLLAKHTGKSMEEMEKATSYDHYFGARESLAFGLCDEIVGFGKLFG